MFPQSGLTMSGSKHRQTIEHQYNIKNATNKDNYMKVLRAVMVEQKQGGTHILAVLQYPWNQQINVSTNQV